MNVPQSGRQRVSRRSALRNLAIGIIMVLTAGTAAWLGLEERPALRTSGILSVTDGAQGELDSRAQLAHILTAPLVRGQIEELHRLRDAQLLDGPTVVEAGDSYIVSIDTTDAAVAIDALDFITVYLATLAAETTDEDTAAELVAATSAAAAAGTALDVFEAEIGFTDIGDTHDRTASEVLQLERQLAGATSVEVQEATQDLLAQRTAELSELESALPQWRTLATRLDAAQLAAVEAERRDELAVADQGQLATGLTISSVSTVSVVSATDRILPIVWTMAIVAVTLAILGWALHRRRMIIDETLAASRPEAPLAPTGPGQFTGPDPRPAVAVVHRPVDIIAPATEDAEPAHAQRELRPPPITPTPKKRPRFVVLDSASTR